MCVLVSGQLGESACYHATELVQCDCISSSEVGFPLSLSDSKTLYWPVTPESTHTLGLTLAAGHRQKGISRVLLNMDVFITNIWIFLRVVSSGSCLVFKQYFMTGSKRAKSSFPPENSDSFLIHNMWSLRNPFKMQAPLKQRPMSGYPFTRKEQHHHIPLQQGTADTVAMRGSCVIGTPRAYSEHARWSWWAEQRMLFTSHTFPAAPPHPPPPPLPPSPSSSGALRAVQG